MSLKTIETLDRRPFKHFCATIGELPTSFIDSMSYYELLAWFSQYLEKTVIPTINENAEAVKELQDLFVELKEYVDNYFQNLDVQEEINNKLDAMAEAGTLQEIMAEYLDTRAVFGFDSVADMKNATNLVDGSFAKTLGFYERGDSGSALYKIRKITNDDVIDESTIIEISADPTNSLIAELIINKEFINPAQLGAKLDGVTDDTSVLSKCLELGNVLLPSDSYIYLENLQIPDYRTIDFNNSHINTKTTAVRCGSIDATEYTRNFEIKNGRFINQELGTVESPNKIIAVYQAIRSRIFNCSFNYTNDNTTAIYVENSFNITIEEIFIGNANSNRTSNSFGIIFNCATPSITGTNNLTNNIIKNGLIQNVHRGIHLQKSDGSIDTLLIDNIGISNSNIGVLIDGPSGSVKNIKFSNSRIENSSTGIYNNGQLTIENIILNKITNTGINNTSTGRVMALGILQYVPSGNNITGLNNAGRFDCSNAIVGYDSTIQVTNTFPIEKRMRISGSHSGTDFTEFISPFDNFTFRQADAFSISDLPTSGLPNATVWNIAYNNTYKSYFFWNGSWYVS